MADRIRRVNFDRAIYFLIGVLASAEVCKYEPVDWRFWCSVLAAGLIALKAKRSKGADAPP